VPDNFDGMGAIPLDAHRTALVRNHELKLETDRARSATRGIAALDARLAGLPHFGKDNDGRVLPGGTTTLVYDSRTGRRVMQHLSLAGTLVNCAGGVTPWGTWLSCEETVLRPGEVARDHGWVFEVPARGAGLVEPVALTAMGRFRHEAAAVDPRTGIVYLTEDKDDSLFYRFLPEAPGRLAHGGRLQALVLRGVTDSRNWSGRAMAQGDWAAAEWIDMDGVDSPSDDLRVRGHARGGTLFARGEGIHRGDGEFFFTCTSGGEMRFGQIMRYVPSRFEGQSGERREPGRLQLFVESADDTVLDYGDNLVVSPQGHLVVCEDRTDDEVNHLRGVTPEGRIYTIARHAGSSSELAGVCFSGDGATMFVNIYSPGQTLAVTGPWGRFVA
jgi:secreted PhoX family phosphatase